MFNLIENITSTKKINLQLIFETDIYGNFTKNALLYQDILLYFSKVVEKDTNTTFTLRNIQRWLVTNNHEFIEDYKGSHISISHKILNRQRRINSIFYDLINLDLIGTRKKTQALITKQSIDLYEFTNHGKLIALLIRSNNLNEEKTSKQRTELNLINQKLFNLLQFICNYKENDEFSYYFSYYKKYFEVAYKNNQLNKIVLNLIKLCKRREAISSVEHLLSKLMVEDILVCDMMDRKEFFKIWNTTITSLEEETKKIILYQQKNFIEREFLLNAKYRNKEIEKVQFDNRRQYDKIALQGFCNKCKNSNIVLLSIYEYKKILIENKDDLKFECKKCNLENSCIIPAFQSLFL